MAAVDRFTITVHCSGPGSIPQTSKTDYSVAALTAATFDAQVTKVDALETAYEALTLGVVSTQSLAVDKFINSGYPSGIANRGSKWIVTSENAAGQPYTHTIPAALATGNVNSDNITANLASTAWAAYKTAFQAVATDRAGGALTLLRAKLGGRRS
jgi:hypothetical protein